MNFLQGLGAGIGGLLDGYRTGVSDDQTARKLAAEEAFKREQMAIMQAQEADRAKQQALEAEARQSIARMMQGTASQAGFQQGPTEPMQNPAMVGLLSGPDPKAAFQDPRLAALMGSNEQIARQPVASMGTIAPPNANDKRSMAFQYAGTDAGKQLGTMIAGDDKLDNLREMLVMRQDTQQQLAAAKNEVEREKIKAQYEAKMAAISFASEDRRTRMLAAAIRGNGTDKATMYEQRAAYGELPKLRQDAQAAAVVLPRLERMKQILETGNAGDTVAYMRQYLSPYAPEAKSANEAQLFQILARTISGPQRVNIIGPGAQTEKELDVLRQVGGGGNQGRKALRELLDIHSTANRASIESYNGMVDAAGTKIYKPIPLNQASQQPTAPPQPRPGYKIQRNKTTGAYREVPL